MLLKKKTKTIRLHEQIDFNVEHIFILPFLRFVCEEFDVIAFAVTESLLKYSDV